MCFIATTNRYQEIAVAAAARGQLEGARVFGARFALTTTGVPAPDLLPEWTRLHGVWKGRSRKEIDRYPRVLAYRDFYARLGLDPNRAAPSVQMIVQRFLRDDVLSKTPRIHPIVDAVNVAAVEAMVPLGVFDASQIVGPIMIDLSVGGEPFRPIGGDGEITLSPGMVVLRDDEKILSQFCHRDSEAQKITAGTHAIWLLGCQVPGIGAADVTASLSRAKELLSRTYMLEAW